MVGLVRESRVASKAVPVIQEMVAELLALALAQLAHLAPPLLCRNHAGDCGGALPALVASNAGR